ncbi:hypothetical protein [Bacillus sp. NEAU-Y102]
MLKGLVGLCARGVRAGFDAGVHLGEKKIETKYRLLNLGIVAGIAAVKLTTKVAAVGVRAVSGGVRLVGSGVRGANNLRKERNRRKMMERRQGGGYDSGTPYEEERKRESAPEQTKKKLKRNEYQENVDPYNAYDYHVADPNADQYNQQENKKHVNEVDKLVEVDPEKLAVIEQLKQEGILKDSGKDSFLDGVYTGDKQFKGYFSAYTFPDGVRTHWDEMSYTLKVAFPTTNGVTLVAKEDGLHSPEGKVYYVHGGTGDTGDKSCALTSMLQDYPMEYTDVLVNLMFGYNDMYKKEMETVQ